MKHFWFYLESHIYVNSTNNKMLLYDTHTGQYFVTASPEAIKIVSDIYADDSLGSVTLSQADVDNPAVNAFVEQVLSMGMGNLYDKEQHPVHPVVLLPILSLNLDVDKFKGKDDVDLFLARDISKYLLDVNITLNNVCSQKCPHCHNYSKQFFCCSKGDIDESLPREYLANLLRQISYYPVRTINITGGDVYQYQDLELFNVSDSCAKKVFNFYIHYLNYRNNPYVDRQSLHILVDAPVCHDRFKNTFELLQGKEVKYHLIVESEEQYQELEVLMEKFCVENFEVHPFYNGQNVLFFQDNVYLSEEDITANTISMREIYRNQKLNANSFGSLYFLPNGEIKANLNERAIGNLHTDSVIDAISEEMTQNTAWRKIRSSEPCKSCIYQHLCPPMSNYERALSTPNLCHVAHK